MKPGSALQANRFVQTYRDEGRPSDKSARLYPYAMWVEEVVTDVTAKL